METPSIYQSQKFDHLAPGEALKKRQKAQDASQQFESIFLKQMIVKMRENASLGEDGGMFGKGPGADTYSQWFDDNMSNAMSQSGQVGVADFIFSDIERNGDIPSEKQAGITKVIERAGMYSAPLVHKAKNHSTADQGRSTDVFA